MNISAIKGLVRNAVRAFSDSADVKAKGALLDRLIEQLTENGIDEGDAIDCAAAIESGSPYSDAMSQLDIEETTTKAAKAKEPTKAAKATTKETKANATGKFAKSAKATTKAKAKEAQRNAHSVFGSISSKETKTGKTEYTLAIEPEGLNTVELYSYDDGDIALVKVRDNSGKFASRVNWHDLKEIVKHAKVWAEFIEWTENQG